MRKWATRLSGERRGAPRGRRLHRHVPRVERRRRQGLRRGPAPLPDLRRTGRHRPRRLPASRSSTCRPAGPTRPSCSHRLEALLEARDAEAPSRRATPASHPQAAPRNRRARASRGRATRIRSPSDSSLPRSVAVTTPWSTKKPTSATSRAPTFCSTRITVVPSSARLRAILRISFTITGARPSDASSMMSTDGLAIRPAPDRQHLLLAARQRAGQLAAALVEAGQHAVDVLALLVDPLAGRGAASTTRPGGCARR